MNCMLNARLHYVVFRLNLSSTFGITTPRVIDFGISGIYSTERENSILQKLLNSNSYLLPPVVVFCFFVFLFLVILDICEYSNGDTQVTIPIESPDSVGIAFSALWLSWFTKMHTGTFVDSPPKYIAVQKQDDGFLLARQTQHMPSLWVVFLACEIAHVHQPFPLLASDVSDDRLQSDVLSFVLSFLFFLIHLQHANGFQHVRCRQLSSIHTHVLARKILYSKISMTSTSRRVMKNVIATKALNHYPVLSPFTTYYWVCN